jgi:hypothetical protein
MAVLLIAGLVTHRALICLRPVHHQLSRCF